MFQQNVDPPRQRKLSLVLRNAPVWLTRLSLMQTAADKGEVQEALNALMALPGMQGYVVINFDGKWRSGA